MAQCSDHAGRARLRPAPAPSVTRSSSGAKHGGGVKYDENKPFKRDVEGMKPSSKVVYESSEISERMREAPLADVPKREDPFWNREFYERGREDPKVEQHNEALINKLLQAAKVRHRLNIPRNSSSICRQLAKVRLIFAIELERQPSRTCLAPR